MDIPRNELFSVLRQYNPWWDGGPVPDLPSWRRAAFRELIRWLSDPPAPRAVLVSGARQVGKTTLLRQAAQELLSQGVRPEQILYVTFDHPLLKLLGLEQVLKLWREIIPATQSSEYLLIDEIQHTGDWGVWLKHQADFQRNRRIAVTGSAIPLRTEATESGVGRWHTIKLPTLSFFEYLQIKQTPLPPIPAVVSLTEVHGWTQDHRIRVGEAARPLIAHFHEYLLRGGFPQTALVDNITDAQRLLREDIVDKVLKRDMTVLFGVRRVLEMEKAFLFLCLHDGGMLDMPTLCSNLEITRPTASHFLDLFEACNLIYKLQPFGYGKEVLRGRMKFYLADAAIAGSVLLKGKALLEDPERLGAAVETAFFKHVYTRYYQESIGFSYWRSKTQHEVDIIAEVRGEIIPFEVKYRQQVRSDDLKPLQMLCREKRIRRAYLITRDMADFAVQPVEAHPSVEGPVSVLRIPAPLACYWLSQAELREETD